MHKIKNINYLYSVLYELHLADTFCAKKVNRMADAVQHHKNEESVIRYYLKFLPPPNTKSVLDIGAGTRAPYKSILQGRCTQYWAVDIRPGNQVDQVVDMTQRTSFQDNQWEWGWCSEVLEHIPPPLKQAFLDEALRVCQHLVVTFPRPWHPSFADDPGHSEVTLNMVQLYSHAWDIEDKSTKTGRAIFIFHKKPA